LFEKLLIKGIVMGFNFGYNKIWLGHFLVKIKNLFGIFSISCHCLLNIINQNKNTNGADVTV
jgi:hypothetical protein